MKEYVRVRTWDTYERPGGVPPLVRALFDPPLNGKFPWQGVAYGMSLPEQARAYPRFPLAIVDDVPIRLINGPPGMQNTTVGWLLEKLANCPVRNRPIRPPDDVSMFFEDAMKAVSPYDGRDSQRIAARQILGLIDNVYHAPVEPGGTVEFSNWREKVAADLAKISVRWDPATSRYLPAK